MRIFVTAYMSGIMAMIISVDPASMRAKMRSKLVWPDTRASVPSTMNSAGSTSAP